MYIMPSAEGGIFLPFKGEKKHIKHYILWYELFTIHRISGYPDFKVLILFLSESTEGVAVGATTAMDYGYYHATNEGGYISWADLAEEAYRAAGMDVRVDRVTTAEYGLSVAARPFNSRLDKSKLVENGFKDKLFLGRRQSSSL